MPTLNTGLVIAGGYADKVRRTLFAQLRDPVKRGEVDSGEVARAVAELNVLLYHILVEALKADKGDAVRVRVDYSIEDGKVRWQYETLRAELFRRVPDEEVAKAVRAVTQRAAELIERAPEYSVERAATTSLGDRVYRVKLREAQVGMLVATPVGEGAAVIRGAVLEPVPAIIEGRRIEAAEGDLDRAVAEALPELARSGRHVEAAEAERAIRGIEGLMEAEARAEAAEAEGAEEGGQ